MPMGKREKISEEKAKILEIIMIVVIIVFAVGSYILSHFIFKSDRNNIVIFVGGEQVTQVNGHHIDININGKYTIGDLNGDYNIIEIKDKKISCIDANCPDKICVQHGYLRDDIDNDMIICAPHRLTIMYE